MRKFARTGLVAAAAAALATTLVAAPAQAELTRLDDGADASASLTDIRVVRVQHTEERVIVKVNFPDLRKQANAGLNVFIVTPSISRGNAISAPLTTCLAESTLSMRVNESKLRSPTSGSSGRLLTGVVT